MLTQKKAINIKSLADLGDSCQIGFNNYINIIFYKNSSNCKLSTFEYLPNLFNNGLDQKNKDLFNKILELTQSVVFFTHVIEKRYVDEIAKHYKLVYCQKVPIGYNKGSQYHCCFYANSPFHKSYEKRINASILENNSNKKIDISFNSFIKKASNEEIEKLRSYKQPKRINDLIKKIKESNEFDLRKKE
jgi:hypothetical protein